jgi:broad specificity phosphatase PhoE/ribosomal protein S18 acetylase RimI-like enzyme
MILVTPLPGTTRASINLRLIRHAESKNNQVYRDARFLFRGGTPDFDQDGWESHVAQYRSADPTLSDVGFRQGQALADYLVPHLINQASHPVEVIVSPMRRTLETIRPTLEQIKGRASICVNALYHESEGCHSKDVPEPGMTPTDIAELLKDCVTGTDEEKLVFEGFRDLNQGWYAHGIGAETREESEFRASTFFLWLCEHLDQQLATPADDVYDAGVAMPGEEDEKEHDKHATRLRKRRTCLLIGHGDFMSLVLKRIVTGFGHAVENEGIPHRSAFVHFNTGMTELEYFGKGRFLIMSQNATPHIRPEDYHDLRGGGYLKDGWSYLMPSDQFILDQEVGIAYADEELDDHVKEQTEALRALYLKDSVARDAIVATGLSVEELEGKSVSFFVKRGLQVVGCAKYDEATGKMTDVVIRPSAKDTMVGEALVSAVRSHARKIGRSGSLYVKPTSGQSKTFFEDLGFEEVEGEEHHQMEIN